MLLPSATQDKAFAAMGPDSDGEVHSGHFQRWWEGVMAGQPVPEPMAAPQEPEPESVPAVAARTAEETVMAELRAARATIAALEAQANTTGNLHMLRDQSHDSVGMTDWGLAGV